MLRSFIAAGFAPADFWRLTPKLYLVYMSGARERLNRERNEHAWLAWHIAYLPRSKRPIKIEKLFHDGGKKPPAAWQSQYSAWVAFAKTQNKRLGINKNGI